MKKVLLLLVFAASFSTLSAQLKYGVKGGINYSNAVGSDAGNNKARVGFHAGALVNLPVTRTFSVQPEAVFSTQGYTLTDPGSPDVNINLSYINIPVLAKLTTAFKLIIETGPQLGCLISARAKQGSDNENVKSFYTSANLSWVFGAGYMAAKTIGVDVRYNPGLTTIVKKATARNSVFQAGIFILLGVIPKK